MQALIFAPLLYWAEAPKPSYWLPATAVLAANLVANWLFVKALALGHFSRTVPLLSLTPAFAAFFGFLLLGEKMSPLQGFGIALVSAGAFVLGRDGKRGRADKVEFRAFLLMLGVAFLWGLNAPFDKQAVNASGLIFHVFFQGFGLSLAFLGILFATKRIHEIAKGRLFLGFLLLATFAGIGALGFQLAAYQRMDVALVETIKRVTGLILALSLGKLLFAEELTRWKVAAALLMAAGLPLVLFN